MDLSIIIPTLNEVDYIETTIERIRACQYGDISIEIIVVDAGSKDRTMDKVAGKVDQIHQDTSLAGAKYKSLNKGAELASGSILLFLDADTLLPENFDLSVKEALKGKKTVGGAFEFGFNRNGVVYRIVEWINRIRYRVDKRYFGDQAIFCAKEIFEQVGGYPKEPIMEAAYFCKVLRRIGKLALIKTPVLTSARRFEQGNVYRVFFKDTWIWIQFTFGLNIKRYALAYWQKNQIT